ncbi:MAG: carbohydrate ABC transporter permease [bacterium]
MALLKNSWKLTKLEKAEAVQCYLFITPWILGFILFTAGPILASLGLSFTQYNLFDPPKFVGLENFKKQVVDDPLFWQSLKVTVYYVSGIPLRLAFALIAAMLLNQKIRALPLFRTIFYLPAVITGVVVALLWSWVFNGQYGLFNYILGLFGIDGPNWLTDTKWVVPAFIIMSLWGIGPLMIIFLASLQNVPQSLIESAEVDGANVLQRFSHITIPMITPIILFNLVIQIISSFQIFAVSYILTGGGPANASLFYVLYLYRNAFEYFKMGYAASLAWTLFVVILLLTVLIFKSSPAWVYYEGQLKGR